MRFGVLIRKPSLTRRLPQLRWRRGEEWPIVGPAERAAYPEFQPEFDDLDALLVPVFRDFDAAALEAQNRFRLLQLLLVSGGAVATVLGAIQAVQGGGNLALGVASAVLACVLTPLAVAVQSGKSHDRFVTSRLKAERLRGEYFLYLTGAAGYAGLDEEARRACLRTNVREIEESEVG